MPRDDLSNASEAESDEGIDRSFVEFPLTSTETEKKFHDTVHGQITLPIICHHVMNTGQFHRLKNLKQLGLCNYVYPSASNNRFEHCVGTSYLAGKYVKRLRKNQPELNITDVDVKCVYLAGLCHDIGHGPFSHCWERFMHVIGVREYKHEHMSLKLLDSMFQEEEVKRHLDASGIADEDVIFIKELILGQPLPGNEEFKGRQPNKHFLYQIVSNDRTKLDVDKIDYLLRDGKQLGVPASGFEYKRIMSCSYVVGYENGELQETIEERTPTIIVYRGKVESQLEGVFKCRETMHKVAYQHRVVRVVEEMVVDALRAAEPYFKVEGSDGKQYSLSTAWKDVDAFVKLTDHIFDMIRLWNYGGPLAARILDDVVRRKLYTFLGRFETHAQDEEKNELRDKEPGIRFIEYKINYGCGGKNPLNNVLFYDKTGPTKLFSRQRGDVTEDKGTIMVYCPHESNLSGGANGEVNGEVTNSITTEVGKQNVEKLITNWAKKYGITLRSE